MVLGPIRQVRNNPFSVTARKSSGKMDQVIRAESLLEYNFLNILDFDPRVEKYGAQCVMLPWHDGSRHRRYYPDVLVKFNSAIVDRVDGFGGDPSLRFRPTIYEVKPTEVLRAEWDGLKPKFKSAQRNLRGTGVRFKLMTERQIDPVFANNVRQLLGYKVERNPDSKYRPEVAMDAELTDLLRGLKEATTPQQVLDHFGLSFGLRARMLARLWSMVSRCLFDADLIEPLTMSTPIWPGQLYTLPGLFPTPKWRQPEYDWYR